jgi:hypothetical protein
LAKLPLNWPLTTTKPTLLHTSAVSARRNDALHRPLRPSQRTVNAALLQEEEHSLFSATPSNKTQSKKYIMQTCYRKKPATGPPRPPLPSVDGSMKGSISSEQ